MKKITPENAKEIGVLVTRHCHSNSLTVFDRLIGDLEKYDNLIEPMVDAFKSMTMLSLDTCSYIILRRATLSRTYINDMGNVMR